MTSKSKVADSVLDPWPDGWPWVDHLRGLIFARFPSVLAFCKASLTTEYPVAPSEIHEILRRRRVPMRKTIERILKALDATPEQLVAARPFRAEPGKRAWNPAFSRRKPADP